MRNFKLLSLFLIMAVLLMGSTIFFSTSSDESVLYVRAAAVYEGEIDTRFLFTKPALTTNNQSFIGDPVVLGHDWVNPGAAVGVITHAQAKYDKHLKLHYLEMVFKITDNNAIHKIKQGLFNKLSIGFTIDNMICSICRSDMKRCAHEPGRYYKVGCNNVLARGLVFSVIGQEVSFVNVPASPNARVLEWSHNQFVMRK